MRDKDICVMGLGETHMEGGAGCDINGMEWVGQGTQHKSGGVGFLMKEGVSYHEFEGGGEGWLLIEIMLNG